MPTDEERRDVAHNIRENYVCGGLGYKVASAYNIAMAIGMNPGLLVGDIDFWNRLADLIEPSCDRERLLAIAAVMAKDSIAAAKQDVSVMPPYILHQARYIAESCGETLASIRSHDVQELGVSIIPGEAIVDHDALLKVADMLECDGECSECECGKGTFCEAPTIAAARIREALGVES